MRVRPRLSKTSQPIFPKSRSASSRFRAEIVWKQAEPYRGSYATDHFDRHFRDRRLGWTDTSVFRRTNGEIHGRKSNRHFAGWHNHRIHQARIGPPLVL